MRLKPNLEITEEIADFFSDGLKLEARFSYADEGKPFCAALVCPPHPFLGGDMNNNVIKAITQELAGRGIPTLTFNYRGIGQSQTDAELSIYQKQFWEHSTCPEYENKIFKDCSRAFETLGAMVGETIPLIVVGYSFGSLAALNLAKDPKKMIPALCLISPPLVKWPLDERAARLSCATAFFYSTGDFACPENELLSAYQHFNEPKQIFSFEGEGHFYLGQEKELAETVGQFCVSWKA